jgi:hypothetical protein
MFIPLSVGMVGMLVLLRLFRASVQVRSFRLSRTAAANAAIDVKW